MFGRWLGRQVGGVARAGAPVFPPGTTPQAAQALTVLNSLEPAADTPRRYHETDSGHIPDEVFRDIAGIVGKTDWRIHKVISTIETANDAISAETNEPLARQEAHYARRGVPEWGRNHPVYMRMTTWKNPRDQMARRRAYEEFYLWEPMLTVQCHSEGFAQIMGQWLVSKDPDKVPTFLFAHPDAYRQTMETLDGQVRVYRHFITHSPVLWGAMRYLSDCIRADVVRDPSSFQRALAQVAKNYNGPNYKVNDWDGKLIRGLIRHGVRAY